MSAASVLLGLLRLGNLGRSIAPSSANGPVEVALSADAGNPLTLSATDGKLGADAGKLKSAVLPAVTAANAGATLGVTAAGAWDVNPFSGPITLWPAIV